MNTLLKQLTRLSLYMLPALLLSVSIAHAQTTGMQDILWTIVANVFGWIVGAGGMLLDYGLEYFVVGFGQQFLTTGVGVAVDQLWVNVRDIFNITFIFGLVYIGFKMILRSDDSSTRTWLIHLIMAALLVNFSLFITKVIVDFSNFLAAQIFINGFSGDVSTTFMNQFGLTSAFSISGVQSLSQIGVSSSGAYSYIFGTAIVFMVAGFVFAAGGIMLIIRYAVLALYMVFSPLMFLGWVFPQMQRYTSQYWSGFLSRAFYAPIFMLVIYFAATVMNGFFGSNGSAGSVGTSNVNFATSLAAPGPVMVQSFQSTIPPFILTCIFLIAAIVIGQKMGAQGAATAMKMGNNLRGRVQRGVGSAAGGATFGAGAALARNTAGRYATNYAESDAGKRRAATSYMGKIGFKAAQSVAGSSFDGRQVAGLGAATGIGSGAKGGYKKTVADQIKADEAFLKDIKTNVDLDDPTTRAAVDKRKEEMEEQAVADAAAQALIPATIATESAKSSEVLSKEINELQAAIIKDKSELRTAEKAGKESKVTISGRESDISLKEQKLRVKMLANNKVKVTSEITKLTDKQAGGETLTAAEQEQLNNKQEALRAVESNIDSFTKATIKRVAALNKKAADATKFAEAEAKYANEIAYMKQLQDAEEFWNHARMKPASSGGGVAGGSTVAGMAGLGAVASLGVMGAGGLLALSSAAASSNRNKASRMNLVDKFGANGMKAAEADASKKVTKAIAEAMKNGGESTDPPPAPAA